jgi:GNAT superfamily N-acetyltransferase
VSLTNYPLISRPCVGRREPKVTSFSIGWRAIGCPERCVSIDPGEALLAAYSEGVLAAIGSITTDPIVPDALRMRRFYVRPAFRRAGIGREIALALLEGALQRVRVVTLNAAVESVPFWEALGFVPKARDGHTHIWLQAKPRR